MSTNSKRENILSTVETALHDLEWVRAIKRQKLTLAQLKEFATTQLPLIGMLGDLPDPRENKRSRGVSDAFISDMSISLVCYGLDNETPDTKISNYLDDLWRILFAINYPRACKVISVDVRPSVQPAIWSPYFAFAIKYVVTYAHDKGGI